MSIRVRVRCNENPLMNGKKEFEENLLLFHWSPTIRRKQILKQGFKVGKPSVDKRWKPPFVCFSADPWLAWQLSGRIHPEISTYDLWMVYAQDTKGMEAIVEQYRNQNGHYIKEYRVYHDIPKRHIMFLGTRTAEDPRL